MGPLVLPSGSSISSGPLAVRQPVVLPAGTPGAVSEVDGEWIPVAPGINYQRHIPGGYPVAMPYSMKPIKAPDSRFSKLNLKHSLKHGTAEVSIAYPEDYMSVKTKTRQSVPLLSKKGRDNKRIKDMGIRFLELADGRLRCFRVLSTELLQEYMSQHEGEDIMTFLGNLEEEEKGKVVKKEFAMLVQRIHAIYFDSHLAKNFQIVFRNPKFDGDDDNKSVASSVQGRLKSVSQFSFMSRVSLEEGVSGNMRTPSFVRNLNPNLSFNRSGKPVPNNGSFIAMKLDGTGTEGASQMSKQTAIANSSGRGIFSRFNFRKRLSKAKPALEDQIAANPNLSLQGLSGNPEIRKQKNRMIPPHNLNLGAPLGSLESSFGIPSLSNIKRQQSAESRISFSSSMQGSNLLHENDGDYEEVVVNFTFPNQETCREWLKNIMQELYTMARYFDKMTKLAVKKNPRNGVISNSPDRESKTREFTDVMLRKAVDMMTLARGTRCQQTWELRKKLATYLHSIGDDVEGDFWDGLADNLHNKRSFERKSVTKEKNSSNMAGNKLIGRKTNNSEPALARDSMPLVSFLKEDNSDLFRSLTIFLIKNARVHISTNDDAETAARYLMTCYKEGEIARKMEDQYGQVPGAFVDYINMGKNPLEIVQSEAEKQIY